MSWFKKKADPISDRARALNSEIAALEAEIKRLDSGLQQHRPAQEHPRLRSTALPHGAAPHRVAEARGGVAPSPGPVDREPAAVDVRPAISNRLAPQEPIFEQMPSDRLQARGENGTSSALYNELGVRKYDLPALVRRIRNHFRGPSTTNPKLVNYLAAGGIQGLRPLRYEKRVARNRFIALFIFLFVVMLGLILALVKQH